MKNAIKRKVALVLGIFLCLGCASCKKGNSGESDRNNSNREPTERTDFDFIKDSASEYKLLLPENRDEIVNFAAQELEEKIFEASGAQLTKIVETGTENAETGKYISLGATRLSEKAQEAKTSVDTGAQGYRMFTEGDDIYFTGRSSEGILNGAYAFLKKFFGYAYYAPGCEKIDKRLSVSIQSFDEYDVPSIDYRAWASYETETDETNQYRLRIQSLYRGWDGMFAHTYFKIVSPKEYGEDYPEWFSGDKKNLCLSNVDRGVFIDNLKQIIEKRPNAKYISIGQEDTFDFCDCDDCGKKIAEWQAKGAFSKGAAMSAIMMEFSNEVAEKIGVWLAEKHPDRAGLKLVTFAYNATQSAPCSYKNGEYAALSEDLKAKDNLAVMIVPYNADYSVTFFENPPVKQQFDSWQQVCKSMYIWMYDINFSNYIQPFFTYGVMADNLRFLKEYGAEYVYIQSSHNVPGMNFHAMKDWVNAQLMWDNTLKSDDLINEFMLAYYKEAAVPLKEYLDLMMSRFAYFESIGQGMYTFDIRFNSTDCWSFGFLNETCMGLFEKAYAAIEKYKATDYELYVTLKNRILRETFYVRTQLLNLYSYEFSNAAALRTELNDDMRKFGIVKTEE